MAVYTHLEIEHIRPFIDTFNIGELQSLQGIEAGMENSNYFVTVRDLQHNRHDYVLTLFEELDAVDLPFHIALLEALQIHNIPVASPLRNQAGQALHTLANKPAVLCPRLKGSHPIDPTMQQCAAIGEHLANIHNALSSFKNADQHSGIRDTHWLQATANSVKPYLDNHEQQLIDHVLHDYWSILNEPGLSKSLIHGDLFRDNSLFEGDRLAGIIDFFNAGYGHCIYDLAIVINDWTLDAQATIKTAHYQSLIKSYQRIRPLTDEEKHHWPVFLKTCALRFWLSRLLTIQQRQNSANRHNKHHRFKDPLQYKSILLRHIEQSIPVIG